ncbi:copper transporter [Spelaeicoccus albus]|uniref:Copper transport outer membrane protein MctB n=1 Tax=Spelaeicoccus albus TaxID=1280376 RepID=A0A7Z0IJ24_9MICO|nr:copper transporter [Spelaeicoccus albus]NYI69093.1 hypothetical protein [Spelaeicoccus albus]
MVDFRFHLVSLISVFLALAVGIVLGAGPLKESIGNSLNEQVEALRANRDNLRANADEARAEADNQAKFLDQVGPALVADHLGGRRVVVVAMPGADNTQVADTSAMVQKAGATVTGEVDVQAAFGSGADRRQVAGSLRKVDPKLPSRGVNATLAAALAKSLVVPDLAEAGKKSDKADLLTTLIDSKLVGSDQKNLELGTLVVVVTGTPSGLTDRTSTASPKPEKDSERHKLVAPYLSLVKALKTRSAGEVVAGTGSSASSGLIGELRSSTSTRASTVDSLGLASGPIVTVMALREQLGGGHGSYGFGKGARDVAPKSQIEQPAKPKGHDS